MSAALHQERLQEEASKTIACQAEHERAVARSAATQKDIDDAMRLLEEDNKTLDRSATSKPIVIF